MPSYLVQVSYNAEAMAAFVKNPQNRAEGVRKSIEKLGGKIGSFWFTFGDYDVAAIIEMPDNISMAAFSMAAGAGGSARSIKTTPLLSAEEGVEVMKKAGTSGFKPVSAKK
jgi:uncharacterized protein with GYD domain